MNITIDYSLGQSFVGLDTRSRIESSITHYPIYKANYIIIHYNYNEIILI